jgi:hypothetical protein
MRKLTAKQAQNCEEAKGHVCRCRCGGALHGAKRLGYEQGREFYENLPEGDPHVIKKKKQDDPKEEIPGQLRLF